MIKLIVSENEVTQKIELGIGNIIKVRDDGTGYKRLCNDTSHYAKQDGTLSSIKCETIVWNMADDKGPAWGRYRTKEDFEEGLAKMAGCIIDIEADIKTIYVVDSRKHDTYANKDKIKEQGGRWNSEEKSWYFMEENNNFKTLEATLVIVNYKAQ